MSKNDENLNQLVIKFIKSLYADNEFIPLHEPRFVGNEKNYLRECIDSTFVSSVGKFVENFETKIKHYTGAKYAVATSSGTSALHISLLLSEVNNDCEVITQSLNFVASCNAISYCNSKPIFIDVNKETMGLCPKALRNFLEKETTFKNGMCINNNTGKIIKACIPMHTYGHPCNINEINEICNAHNIFLIEDAAESVGSIYKGRHTGTVGQLGTFSFNGNKIITAGGGGCIITNNETLAKKAKHISTTAKVPHKWEFYHDQIGYNYRMPNLNAALLLAQLENLDKFILNKRNLAQKYNDFFKNTDITFFTEPESCISNYWLNSIIFSNKRQRDLFLEYSNSNNVMTRPVWNLMHTLPMFSESHRDELRNSSWLHERLVNIPSSCIL